jgi:hypothetical protein
MIVKEIKNKIWQRGKTLICRVRENSTERYKHTRDEENK